MKNSSKAKLQKLFDCIIDEMIKNDEFNEKISVILSGDLKVSLKQGKKGGNKRNAAILNPVELAMNNDLSLKDKLDDLTIEQLKDIIAEYGMDNARLAMKWRNEEKLIQLILETAQRRSTKGDAFRDN